MYSLTRISLGFEASYAFPTRGAEYHQLAKLNLLLPHKSVVSNSPPFIINLNVLMILLHLWFLEFCH